MNKKALGRRAIRFSSNTVVTRGVAEELPLGGAKNQAYHCGTDGLRTNKQASASSSPSLLDEKHKQGHDGTEYSLRKLSRKMNLKTDGTSAKDTTSGECPTHTKQLPLALVADSNYVKKFGVARARDALLTEMNIVDGIFLEAFNVGISITSIELLQNYDPKNSFDVPCATYPGLHIVLNKFSDWRNSRSSDAGVYHLVLSYVWAQISLILGHLLQLQSNCRPGLDQPSLPYDIVRRQFCRHYLWHLCICRNPQPLCRYGS